MSAEPEPHSFSNPGGSIVGTQLVEQSVGGIEVLLHRCVALKKWQITGPGSPFWRLYYPLSDGAEVLCGDMRQLLRAGEVYLIPPHSRLSFEAHLPFTKWYLHFTLKGDLQQQETGMYLVQRTEPIDHLLARVCPLPDSADEPCQPFDTIGLIALCLSHCTAVLGDEQQSDARLQRAVQLMHARLTEKLTLADICTVTGLRERALNHLFLRHTGLSPIRYLIELRLNEACRLLRYTDASVEEVAESSGFANRFYLDRMMKKHRHLTAAGFRRAGK